jgi:hypothetical protein
MSTERETAAGANGTAEQAEVIEGLELAWGIIANVDGGDLTKQNADWQDAVRRWANRFLPIVGKELQARALAQPRSTEGAEAIDAESWCAFLDNGSLEVDEDGARMDLELFHRIIDMLAAAASPPVPQERKHQPWCDLLSKTNGVYRCTCAPQEREGLVERLKEHRSEMQERGRRHATTLRLLDEAIRALSAPAEASEPHEEPS